MVPGDGVQHFLARLAVPLGQLGPDLRVAPFHLVVGRLADVVQEGAPAGEARVQPDFAGHHAGQVADFQAVVQDVLGVTGAELQPAEQLDELVVDQPHVGLGDGRLADFHDVLVHLLLRLGNHFLNARRVDAAVLDQLLQGEAGDLPADAVEGADDDHAGRVVHDHVHAADLLEGADIPPFAADDAALHVVGRDVHGADSRLRRVRGRVPLDGRREDLPRLLLTRRLEPVFVLLHPQHDLLRHVPLDSFEQQSLRLVAAQAGQAGEALHLLADHLLHLGRLAVENFFLLGELLLGRLDDSVFLHHVLLTHLDRVLPLLERALQLPEFGALDVGLAAELVSLLEELVLGPQLGVLGDALGVLAGRVEGFPGAVLGLLFLVLGLCLGFADFALHQGPPDGDPRPRPGDQRQDDPEDGDLEQHEECSFTASWAFSKNTGQGRRGADAETPPGPGQKNSNGRGTGSSES